MRTFSPTQAPTTRGPDLFTVLVQLQGVCQDCSDKDNLFDQTTDGRKLQAQESVTRNLNFYQDICICPVGAEEGRLSKEGFLEAWEKEKEAFGDQLMFYEERKSFEEVQVFDCVKGQDKLVSVAPVEFSGDLTLLSGEEIGMVEESYLLAFNGLAEQVCDPLIRTLTAKKTKCVVVSSEMRSSAGPLSDQPSSQPLMTPSAEPLLSPSTLSPSMSPDVCSAPSVSIMPSTTPSNVPSLVANMSPADSPLAPLSVPPSALEGRRLIQKRQQEADVGQSLLDSVLHSVVPSE